MNTNPPRRRIAKRLYWLSGWASKVQTPRQTYRITGSDFETEPAGRRWMPCRFSMWLLKQSMRWDPSHWDHWALQHTHCEPTYCVACGGCYCDDRDFLDNH